MAVVPAAAPAADDFTSAFDELAALGEKPVPVEFGKTEAAKVDPPKPAAPAPETPAAPVAEETGIEPLTDEEKAAAAAAAPEPEAKTPEQIAAEAKAAEDAAKSAAAQQADDERLAKIIKAVKGDEPEKKTPEPAPTPTPPLYSDDDVKVLTQLETDFPEVAKALMIQGRALAAQVTQHIFAEMTKVLGPKLAAYDEMLNRAHARTLHEKVPDYDDVREKVLEWVSKQPAYLQGGYTHVIEDGTDDEVTDLIERFRKDTGVAKPAPAAPAKPANELSPAAKKAVAALAPVPAKRSSAVAQTSPDDFDGAFAQAMKELEKA